MAAAGWREADAKWKGQMNIIVRELDKNQSELEILVQSLQKAHNDLVTKCAVLRTQVKQNRGRWDRIIDIAAAIVVSSVAFTICHTFLS